MTELEQYIQSYFAVDDNKLADIAASFQFQKVNKGDFLLKQGRVCGQLSFISTGLVRIYTVIDDKEVTQWISTQGYFVTDLASFIFNTPARWQIQALTDCTLYSITKEDYNNIGNTIPEWHQLEKLFIAKCFVLLEDRVSRHLYMSSEERYQFLLDQQPNLFNEVPLQYLASMLGMTPETLSRLRKKHLS
ncbi:MAG: Crp/Fnr family transcriptional regulator [Flavipsychrobacter sp.]